MSGVHESKRKRRNDSDRRNKRKRVVVTLEMKLDGIRRSRKGESLKSIAADLGVGETTVGDWKRNANQIEEFAANLTYKTVSERKSLRKPKCETLEEALVLWFKHERAKGVSISGPMIQEKAMTLNKEMNGLENFCASKGWLDKFKTRHGIRQMSVVGEKKSTNEESFGTFTERFLEVFNSENLLPQHSPNIVETKLCSKMLPSKTLAMEEEKIAPNFKEYLDDKNLLEKSGSPLDNASYHPDENSSSCENLKSNVPPNLPSMAHFMEQGVIENIKKMYRNQLLPSILLDNDKPSKDLLKEVSVKNVSPKLASEATLNTKIKEEAQFEAVPSTPSLSHSDGTSILFQALRYLQDRGDVPLEDLLVVKNWRDRAALDRVSTLTQKTVSIKNEELAE